jgi:Zn-dependent membrane protease YugP
MTDRRTDMSLLAILLFSGIMALTLWATIRVRLVYSKFSMVPASSGSTGANAAARILRQDRIYDIPRRQKLRRKATIISPLVTDIR